MFTFEFDQLDWASQFYNERRETSKLAKFQDVS